ncbi:MAG: trypsin-like peptidase domain-containing protein [Bacillota bacterium]|nr:trypsin-like peptidase domain-containing protein [Bacillota bacterium]
MDNKNENIFESSVSDSGINTPPSANGEYHYVRPERRLYEDAEFVVPGESAEIPSYYVPSEKKPKEKSEKSDKPKKNFLKIACLCLACAIFGGLLGGGTVLLLHKDAPGTTVNSGVPIVSDGQSSSKVSSNANDVYAIGCQQVVGITTSVNYTDFLGQQGSVAVSGSGFVVTVDGYILTNYHVVKYAHERKSSVTVMFKDGSAYEAAIVGFDAENDLAVLKIDASNLTPVSVGDSSSIKVGDTVYAIGNPLGELDFSMTTGSISALDRSIVTDSAQPAINMFQFDAAVNSGNSGGPVYNTSGQVIGMVTAKSGVEGTEGLGFAIPINDAVEIANELITKGYVSSKAYMGVNIDTRYTSVYAQYYGIPEGAYVFSVEAKSCADKAGLRAGDIITAIGDSSIKSYSDLYSSIRQFKAGDSTELTVYREDDYITLKITFDESKPDTEESNFGSESGLYSYPNYS